MKRILLLLMTLVLTVSGIKAAPSISKNGSTITLSGFNAGDLAKVFAGEIEGISASNFSGVSSIVFGSGCTLNADDFTAMSSTTHSELSGVKTVDMSNATVSVDTSEGSTATAISTMSGMNLSKMEYLRLPNNMTSADDVAEMKDLKKDSNNASLKIVGAYDPSPAYGADVAMHSFVENSVPAFLTQMNIPTSGNPNPVPRKIRMSGEYGKNDLVNNGTPTMGYETSAEWDFTGAHFANCTISQGQTKYYNYDDPFCDNGLVAPTTSSNTFYYFAQYRKQVVDIKLPDNNMTNLPASCLEDLAADNKNGYIALYGQAKFDANKVEEKSVPIETLVIPNCYTDLEQECGMWARIRHLVIGGGIKQIHGGAFLKCDYLEDLDFGAGLSDCYIGDQAFDECKSMKHIALSEGIVSLGFKCFHNSQHLESIRLPETLVNIGNQAFDNCLALSSMTIPSNVEKIGKMAFKLCPISDFYLTTTDPNKIPYVYSLGTNYDSFDGNCTFYNSHLWGWNTINGVDEESDKQFLATMTWDQAVDWYFALVSGMAVLHYPKELAEKVRASISDSYSAVSSDGFKLPMDQDKHKRDNISGADLGSSGNGKFTQDGWAQFLLMKGYEPEGEDIVYTKEYKDVWYTMCFPFDLTDEQLAAAFNETFNIADFSGVEVVEKTDTDPLKLILHFNKVAVTYYKDVYGKIYHRLCENGSSQNDIYWGEEGQVLWREQHGNFKYNVYIDDEDNIYHHVHPKGGKLDTNKTKTFAISTEAGQGNADNAIIIDGILGEAGHPYMIHPAIGVNPGQPAVACKLAGITWKDSPTEKERASSDCNLPDKPSVDEYRDWLYNHMARTVDLGHGSTRDENRHNYYQADYTSLGYSGNTYTFKGNPRDFKDGWKNDTSLPARPTDAELVEPKAPQNPNPKPKAPKKAELSEPENPADNQVSNPAEDTETYPAKFRTFYNATGGYNGNYDDNNIIWGEAILNFSLSDLITGPHNWGRIVYQWAHGNDAFGNYFNGTRISEFPADELENYQNKYNELKSLCQIYRNAINDYNDYLARVESYDDDYNAYLLSKKEWDKYRSDLAEWNSWKAPADVQAAYDAAYLAWQTAVTNYNTWKTAMGDKGYNVVIPQYAYFLGTPAGAIYPKYFRERESKPNRSTGLWTQYSAIILPNAAALAGLETDLGGVTTSSGTGSAPGAKSHDIAFDEDYFFINDTPQGIATLIEKIEKEEGKADVEYMDIVVSIDGKIVSRDKTTFEGLPKGVYIINGKKYYVK